MAPYLCVNISTDHRYNNVIPTIRLDRSRNDDTLRL